MALSPQEILNQLVDDMGVGEEDILEGLRYEAADSANIAKWEFEV